VDSDEPRVPASVSKDATAQKPCWTRNRCELREWLRRNAASLAELYEGAVLLLFDAPIPGYTRFVAHAVRETRNRLPDVSSGTKSGGQLSYKGRMDDLVLVWKKEGLGTDGTFPASNSGGSPSAMVSQDTALPRKVVVMISSLVADHEATRQKPIDAAVRLFEGVAPDNQKFRDAIRPVVVQWLDITEWFMKRAHDSGSTDRDTRSKQKVNNPGSSH
jgi:hypothetical protein